MTKRIQRKNSFSRKFGVNMWSKPNDPFTKRNYASGEHGKSSYKRSTDFGIQLKAKQLIKFYYCNITEKQFKRIYDNALKKIGDTGQNLVGLLESRLDAFLYRTKFAPTFRAARQLISHKHIAVNGQTVNIASYTLKIGDEISVREKSSSLEIITNSVKSSRTVPTYISADSVKLKASFLKVPELSEIPYGKDLEPMIKPHLVTEFYSR